ncbi:MAG: HAD hydrolase-like protein, partial [Victivallaceae bacterium]
CALALKPMAQHHHWQDKKFFLMGSVGQNPTYAELAGLSVTSDIEEIDQCFGIINGEGYFNWFHYFAATLNFFRRHPDAPYIVANPDSYWPDADDQYGIAAGGQARFICTLLNELGIRKEPIYLGKPYKIIYEYALEAVAEINNLPAPLSPRDVLMVGDSLKSDILGANQANLNSGLVLTGLTTEAEALQAPGDFRPKQIFKSLI